MACHSFRATSRPKDIPIECCFPVAAARKTLVSDHMGNETHIFGAMSPIRARKAALFVLQRPYREKTKTVREIPGLSSIPRLIARNCPQMHPSVSSKQIQKARQMAKRSRTAVACARCKAAKIKCSDYRPCKQCVNFNSPCTEVNDPKPASNTSILPQSREQDKIEKVPLYIKANHNVPSHGDTVASYEEANPHTSSYLREAPQNSMDGPLSSYLPTQIAFSPFGCSSVQASISSPAASSFSRYPTTDAQFLQHPPFAPLPSMHPCTMPPMSLLPPALSTLLLSSVCDEGFRALPMMLMASPQPLALQMLPAFTAAPRSAIRT